MKTHCVTPRPRVFQRPQCRRAGGSALLIVLLLLSLMATLMVSNAVNLRRLKVELQILEQKQKRAWMQQPGPAAPQDKAQGGAPSPASVTPQK